MNLRNRDLVIARAPAPWGEPAADERATFTRRQAFAVAARTGLSLTMVGGLLAASKPSEAAQPWIDLVATPTSAEGPFFVDEKIRTSNLLANAHGRTTVLIGVPLTLEVAVYKISGKRYVPLEGATVDVWHADTTGVYSDEGPETTNGEDTTGQTWLRGYQVTDANGAVEFKTIYPGWQSSRAVHIHFKVRQYDATGNATATFNSQWFFDDKLTDAVYKANSGIYSARGPRGTTNSTDEVYQVSQADGSVAGDHLLLNMSPNASGKGYVGTFAIALAS